MSDSINEDHPDRNPLVVQGMGESTSTNSTACRESAEKQAITQLEQQNMAMITVSAKQVIKNGMRELETHSPLARSITECFGLDGVPAYSLTTYEKPTK
ncbi:hypothetical protein Hte_009574 [Hypoxylon texense]